MCQRFANSSWWRLILLNTSWAHAEKNWAENALRNKKKLHQTLQTAFNLRCFKKDSIRGGGKYPPHALEPQRVSREHGIYFWRGFSTWTGIMYFQLRLSVCVCVCVIVERHCVSHSKAAGDWSGSGHVIISNWGVIVELSVPYCMCVWMCMCIFLCVCVCV